MNDFSPQNEFFWGATNPFTLKNQYSYFPPGLLFSSVPRSTHLIRVSLIKLTACSLKTQLTELRPPRAPPTNAYSATELKRTMKKVDFFPRAIDFKASLPFDQAWSRAYKNEVP